MARQRQAAKTKSKWLLEAEQKRKEFWGDVEDQLWHRKSSDGFITIPRTMPYILNIIDELTRGKPASSTYFTLWCHTNDASLVQIDNAESFAYESGFFSERKATTWKQRMRSLKECNFIDNKEGSHEFSYILLYNPHIIIKDMKEEILKIKESLYYTLIDRAHRVGAKKDFE